MAEQYTPSRETVKRTYISGARNAHIASVSEHADEFERWLAAHDAQVRVEALRDAAEWKRQHNLGNSVWGDYLQRLADEKYRAGGDDMVTIWLDDRADRIADTDQQVQTQEES